MFGEVSVTGPGVASIGVCGWGEEGGRRVSGPTGLYQHFRGAESPLGACGWLGHVKTRVKVDVAMGADPSRGKGDSALGGFV